MQQNWEKLEKEIASHRAELTERLTDFARTDVMLFLSTDKKLLEQQKEKWLPVVNWVNATVNTDFKPTTSLDVPQVSKDFLKDFKNYESIKENAIDVDVYSDGNDKIKLDIVLKNGNIYIKSRS